MSEGNTAAQIRKLEERLAALERGARGPQRFSKSGGGGGATKLAKVKALGVKHNHLECQFWDEKTDTLGADVLVAKPYYFRVSTYKDLEINGITYEDAVSPDGYTQSRRAVYEDILQETQYVTPHYFEGAVLTIEKVNGLRLQADMDSEDDPPEMVTCHWRDRNDEPRAWTT
jgi:hypothetical protein